MPTSGYGALLVLNRPQGSVKTGRRSRGLFFYGYDDVEPCIGPTFSYEGGLTEHCFPS